MFVKNIESFVVGRLPRTEEANARYRNIDNDPRGPWKPGDISVKTYNVATDYPISDISCKNSVIIHKDRFWEKSRKHLSKTVVENKCYKQ